MLTISAGWSFDAEISKKEEDINAAIGLERWVYRIIGLRAGVAAGSRERREITAGMGYKGEHFSLDYAFIFPLSGVTSTVGSHRFGVTIRFGAAPERARWEFESEGEVFERLIEEKAAQIKSMEKEMRVLNDQNRRGRLEDKWVRDQIQKLQLQLRNQETQELAELKKRLFESKVESQRMRRQMEGLEKRLRRISVPKPAAPVKAKPVEVKPVVPKTYTVQEGETLQSIAEEIYGVTSKWVEIYEMNSDRIERGGSVRTGQILILAPVSRYPASFFCRIFSMPDHGKTNLVCRLEQALSCSSVLS